MLQVVRRNVFVKLNLGIEVGNDALDQRRSSVRPLIRCGKQGLQGVTLGGYPVLI